MSPQSQVPISNYETFHLPLQMQQQVGSVIMDQSGFKFFRWWWILELQWRRWLVLMGTSGRWECHQAPSSRWTAVSNERWVSLKSPQHTTTFTSASSKDSDLNRNHTVRTATTSPSNSKWLDNPFYFQWAVSVQKFNMSIFDLTSNDTILVFNDFSFLISIFKIQGVNF